MTKKTLAILGIGALAALAAAATITTLQARGTGTAQSANGRMSTFTFETLRVLRDNRVTVNRGTFAIEAQDPDARGPVVVKMISMRNLSIDGASATFTGPGTLTFVRKSNGQRVARTGTVRVVVGDNKRPNNPTGTDRLAVRFDASGTPLSYEYGGAVRRGDIVVRKEVRNNAP